MSSTKHKRPSSVAFLKFLFLFLSPAFISHVVAIHGDGYGVYGASGVGHDILAPTPGTSSMHEAFPRHAFDVEASGVKENDKANEWSDHTALASVLLETMPTVSAGTSFGDNHMLVRDDLEGKIIFRVHIWVFAVRLEGSGSSNH